MTGPDATRREFLEIAVVAGGRLPDGSLCLELCSRPRRKTPSHNAPSAGGHPARQRDGASSDVGSAHHAA